MRQYKITIPEPCTERWQEMSPTEKGAYCKKCSKEVIDFTQVSQLELRRKLATGEALCGRFRRDQLDRPLPVLSRNSWKQKVAALGFSALLSVSCTKEALLMEDKIAFEEVEATSKPLKITVGTPVFISTAAIISGKVTDGERPLAGATILLKGTERYVQTDIHGQFKFEVPVKMIEGKAELLFTYVGFEAHTHLIKNGSSDLEIELIEDETVLGEVLIIEDR